MKVEKVQSKARKTLNREGQNIFWSPTSLSDAKNHSLDKVRKPWSWSAANVSNLFASLSIAEHKCGVDHLPWGWTPWASLTGKISGSLAGRWKQWEKSSSPRCVYGRSAVRTEHPSVGKKSRGNVPVIPRLEACAEDKQERVASTLFFFH